MGMGLTPDPTGVGPPRSWAPAGAEPKGLPGADQSLDFVMQANAAAQQLLL